jgi:hypothetical protein
MRPRADSLGWKNSMTEGRVITLVLWAAVAFIPSANAQPGSIRAQTIVLVARDQLQ